MPGGASVRVEGAAELKRTLLAAGLSLEDLKATNQRVVDRLLPLIVARTPVGKTHRLVGSVRGSGTKTAAITRAGGAKVPYARPIHWGWPARHIAPQRFAWDVLVNYRELWEAMYENECERVLDSVKGV
jgi:hypothetical protein